MRAAGQIVAEVRLKWSSLQKIKDAINGSFDAKTGMFSVTVEYADGGKENWLVNPSRYGDGVLLNSNTGLQAKDGIKKPSENCPKQG